MKLNSFLKGLIMAIVGFVATLLSDMETINFAVIVISTVGFTIYYTGKNYLMPSISVVGIDIRDILSGILLAVGMAISNFAAQIIIVGHVDWGMLGKAVLGAIIGYFAKTVPSNAKAKKK